MSALLSYRLNVLVSEAEMVKIRTIAEACGMTVSTFVRVFLRSLVAGELPNLKPEGDEPILVFGRIYVPQTKAAP